VELRRTLGTCDPSLCHAGAAHVYLEHQVPVAGFVLFSSWVGILPLNSQEKENNQLKISFKIIIK